MKEKTETNSVKSYLNLSTQPNGKCLCSWKGEAVELADLVFTAMNNDTRVAAIVCQTAKDYIDTCKGDLDKWKKLTTECAEISAILAARYRKPTSRQEETIDGKEEA